MTIPRVSGSRKSRTPLAPFRDPTAAAAFKTIGQRAAGKGDAMPPAEVAALACRTWAAPFNPIRVSDRTRARACELLDVAHLSGGFALAVWLIALGLYSGEDKSSDSVTEGGDA